jgi:hypothetical protein
MSHLNECPAQNNPTRLSAGQFLKKKHKESSRYCGPGAANSGKIAPARRGPRQSEGLGQPLKLALKLDGVRYYIDAVVED